MCKGFDCLDCPAFKSENCYYYGKGFIDYYRKIQLEKMNIYHQKEFPTNKLAVISSDGNLVGEFIAKSLTLSDLFSRIIHVSNTMFEIFDLIEDILQSLEQEEDIVRLKLGRIYIGGDDILILVPGYLAIPIALTLTKEFYRKLGR